MYITKEKFKEICKKYYNLIVVESDAEDALNFVQDLLEAESDALKSAEPDAFASINRLDAAAYEVYELCNQVSNQEFGLEE